MKPSAPIAVVASAVFVFAALAAAQQPTRRAPGAPADDKVGVNVALQLSGGAYQFNGQASCTHEPKGYIYGIAARLWRVQQSEGSRSMTLTLWSPASGADNMFSLYVTTGGRSYETTTVKAKDAGATKGSGNVKFAPAGNGGIFSIDATAADGAKISGTIKCAAFRAAIAEGGN